jgi:regulatory protein
MPTVTALRPARPGHVHVELDGARWRRVPVEVAARVGLAAGVELDRERLRTLRRELRRSEALAAGARVLERRERSEHDLRSALERKRIGPRERERAIAALREASAVDDERYASSRAAALAARGRGDAAIAFELERHGIERETVTRALAALEPERERARRLASRRERNTRTARWLAQRGFSEDSIEAALPAVAGDAAAELG